jgi:hypothetical protein
MMKTLELLVLSSVLMYQLNRGNLLMRIVNFVMLLMSLTVYHTRGLFFFYVPQIQVLVDNTGYSTIQVQIRNICTIVVLLEKLIRF